MTWAIRIGLLLLVIGQFFGVAIIVNELTQDASIETASIFGVAGQIKVPHAVSLHAIQVLPILAWLFQFTNWPEDRRTKSVLAAAAGYIGLVLVSAIQTFTGLAPIDLSLPAALLLLISIIAIGAAFLVALFALKQSFGQAINN